MASTATLTTVKGFPGGDKEWVEDVARSLAVQASMRNASGSSVIHWRVFQPLCLTGTRVNVAKLKACETVNGPHDVC